MNTTQRRIDIANDRDALLAFHSQCNYGAESPLARQLPYERYEAKWLSTIQPDSFLRDLKESLSDARTIAELWTDENGEPIAYLWVTFTDVPDYDFVYAEVRDIAVIPKWRHCGIGTRIMTFAETQAKGSGANVLRSETGAENLASRRLHEAMQFQPYTVRFEKVLTDSAVDSRLAKAEQNAPA
jgi:GNAT superfamily N-acetyltransferase